MAQIGNVRTTNGVTGESGAQDTVTGFWHFAWIAVVVAIVVLTYGSCGQMLKFMYFEPHSAGDTGTHFVRDPGGPSGTVVVHDLKPGSVLAAAGVRDGDRVRLDYPWDDLRMPKAGETFGLTQLSHGKPQHVSVVLPAVAPMPEADKAFAALTPLANMTIALIGLFVALRSRGDRATMLLGTGFALVGPLPPYVWPLPATHVPFWQVPVWVGIDVLPLFLLGFAISYVERATGSVPRWQKMVFRGLVMIQVLSCVYEIADTLLNLSPPLIGLVRPLNYILQIIALILPLYFFAIGWLKSPPEMRARFTLMFMFIALPITFVAQSAYVLATLLGSGLVDLKSPFIVAAGVGIFIGPLLFTYAVFRHKVLDIGFAINRTLVYGVLSVILLLVFGLIEWASEKFIPIESREKNLFIDAGIALGIFLAFHRVRDLVEGFIEKLFFSAWHHNEAQLKRFVAQSGFVSKADVLKQRFTAELERFTGGAGVRLYLADGDTFSSGGHVIDNDDPLVVAMKAEQAAIEAPDGFVRLGLKPSGDGYRPDEREVLTWATHQIGLDLYALKVEALEQRVTELDTQVTFLVKSGLAAQKKLR